MSKRKLIEYVEDPHLYCDNAACGFKLPEVIPTDELQYWINVKCPHCNENLLTFDDYNRHLVLLRSIAWLNKWFSWIMIFVPKNAKMIEMQANTHKKLTLTKIDNAA